MDPGLRSSLQALLHDFWKLLHFLSPLRGSVSVSAYPGLTPWASFLRRFAACVAGRADHPDLCLQLCIRCRKSDA